MKNDALNQIADLEAPTYHNTTTVLSLGGQNLTLWDVVKAALAARLNLGLYGGEGLGKSQLLADIKSLFGNNASYVLGRNDLLIKDLYRELNFTKLNEALKNGGTVSQQELSQVTGNIHQPLTVVEEINRCVEVVQNQFFNIFEGFVEIDGKKYALGAGELKTYRDFDGSEWTQNVLFSVGVWSANFGNGQYTGTVSMDQALRGRSNLILDVDNFCPQPSDLDDILLKSGGEIRLKDQENPSNHTNLFIDAFSQFKQQSYTPDSQFLGEELLLFRYLVLGLDYIPCLAANNSKRIMKEVWPGKAEEDNIGTTDDDKTFYRMLYPASIRGALGIITLARALKGYVQVKNPKANVSVLDSVIESFKLVGAYSGMIQNPQRIREYHVGNPYLAASHIGQLLKQKLDASTDLRKAIISCKVNSQPLPPKILNVCIGEYACFR